MRILMVNHEFPPLGGGGATACYFLSRELGRLGHEITVVTARHGELPAETREDSVQVIRLNCGRRNVERTTFREALMFVGAALGWVRTWGRRGAVDVVQTFFALPNGPVGHLASSRVGCPHVIRISGADLPEHDPDRYRTLERILRPITRWYLDRASRLVVNSEGFREKAMRYYPHLDFTVIPNGVDLTMFEAHPGDRPVNNPPRLLFVSRLVERKGLHFLLRALASLKQQGLTFVLDVVGDGPQRGQLETLVSQLGLTNQVQFYGAMQRMELPPIYRSADVFVLPSLSEGMPNVVLEAMSCGLPIIGTRVPGTEELVLEGVNGWLATPGSVAELERCVLAALRCSNLPKIGRASRRRAEDYAWSTVARTYEALYCDLVCGSQEQTPRRDVRQ